MLNSSPKKDHTADWLHQYQHYAYSVRHFSVLDGMFPKIVSLPDADVRALSGDAAKRFCTDPKQTDSLKAMPGFSKKTQLLKNARYQLGNLDLGTFESSLLAYFKILENADFPFLCLDSGKQQMIHFMVAQGISQEHSKPFINNFHRTHAALYKASLMAAIRARIHEEYTEENGFPQRELPLDTTNQDDDSRGLGFYLVSGVLLLIGVAIAAPFIIIAAVLFGMKWAFTKLMDAINAPPYPELASFATMAETALLNESAQGADLSAILRDLGASDIMLFMNFTNDIGKDFEAAKKAVTDFSQNPERDKGYISIIASMRAGFETNLIQKGSIRAIAAGMLFYARCLSLNPDMPKLERIHLQRRYAYLFAEIIRRAIMEDHADARAIRAALIKDQRSDASAFFSLDADKSGLPQQDCQTINEFVSRMCDAKSLGNTPPVVTGLTSIEKLQPAPRQLSILQKDGVCLGAALETMHRILNPKYRNTPIETLLRILFTKKSERGEMLDAKIFERQGEPYQDKSRLARVRGELSAERNTLKTTLGGLFQELSTRFSQTPTVLCPVRIPRHIFLFGKHHNQWFLFEYSSAFRIHPLVCKAGEGRDFSALNASGLAGKAFGVRGELLVHYRRMVGNQDLTDLNDLPVSLSDGIYTCEGVIRTAVDGHPQYDVSPREEKIGFLASSICVHRNQRPPSRLDAKIKAFSAMFRLFAHRFEQAQSPSLGGAAAAPSGAFDASERAGAAAQFARQSLLKSVFDPETAPNPRALRALVRTAVSAV
jgi:hypothetical protein